MNPLRVAFLLLLCTTCFGLEKADYFEQLYAKAHEMGETEDGKTYEKKCEQPLAKPMREALLEATKGAKPPYDIKLVITISNDGVARQLVAPKDDQVSEAVAAKLIGLQFPPPPKGGWMIGVTIHVKE